MRLDLIRQKHEGKEFSYGLDFERQLVSIDLSPALAADIRNGKHARKLFEFARKAHSAAWSMKEMRAFLRECPGFLKSLVERRSLFYLDLNHRGETLPDLVSESREMHHEIRKYQESLLKPNDADGKTIEEVIRAYQSECVEKWLGLRLINGFDGGEGVKVALVEKVKKNLSWTLGKGEGRRNAPIPELDTILRQTQDPLLRRKIRQVLKNLHKDLMACRHFREHARRHRIVLAAQYQPTLVNKFIQERLAKGISSESLKSEMQIIERMWDFAERSDLILKNRIRGFKVGVIVGDRNIKTDRSTLTMREAALLLGFFDMKASEADFRNGAFWREALYLCLVLILTGCRPSELNFAIYDAKHRILRFNPLERGHQVAGKTASSVRILRVEPGSALDIIFKNQLFKGWASSNVAERFQGFLDRLKAWPLVKDEEFLRHFTTKILRKTCVTWRLALGHDKATVAEELGHSQGVAESHYLDKYQYLRVIGFHKETAEVVWKWFQNCLVWDKESKSYALTAERPFELQEMVRE